LSQRQNEKLNISISLITLVGKDPDTPTKEQIFWLKTALLSSFKRKLLQVYFSGVYQKLKEGKYTQVQ
jgi:hypothetical protein